MVCAINWGSGLGSEMQLEDFGRSSCLTLPICHQHPLLCGREKRGVWLQRCLLCLACHCWWQIWCARVAINGGAAFLLAPSCFVSFHHPALSLKWTKHWILETEEAGVADAFVNSMREDVLWSRPGCASRFLFWACFQDQRDVLSLSRADLEQSNKIQIFMDLKISLCFGWEHLHL